MKIRVVVAFLALSLALVARSGAREKDERALLRTVASVDLQRYTGRWYEIARLPNRFERQCAGEVTADYKLRPDGLVDVLNRCRQEDGKIDEAKGVARLPDASKTAQLEVRFAPAFLSFLPFVWGDYWIIDLAPDYSFAAVGDPSRAYFWILSRTPQMPEVTYQAIVERAAAQGFAINRLIKTRQVTPEAPSP